MSSGCAADLDVRESRTNIFPGRGSRKFTPSGGSEHRSRVRGYTLFVACSWRVWHLRDGSLSFSRKSAPSCTRGSQASRFGSRRKSALDATDYSASWKDPGRTSLRLDVSGHRRLFAKAFPPVRNKNKRHGGILDDAEKSSPFPQETRPRLSYLPSSELLQETGSWAVRDTCNHHSF